MAQISFPQTSKSVKLPSGTTYTYVYSRPSQAGTPTVLFLHGFPSSSWDWRHQIRHFSDLGFGVLAPDLLGYGGTDKPEDPRAYTLKRIAGHVAEILEHEQIPKVHGVGHDFGSPVLSRLVNYRPTKLLSCSFLSIPYSPPATEFNIDALKEITEKALGFEKYAYMRFASSPDSWKVLEAHAESAESLIYADDALWIENVYPPGALERWVTQDRMAPRSAFVTSDELQTRRKIFAAGGYRGPTNYYRALLGGLSTEEESKDDIDPAIKCPVLVITEADGPGTLPYYAESTKQYAADCRTAKVSTQGHWVQLEARDEVNRLLAGFFHEIDGKLSSKL